MKNKNKLYEEFSSSLFSKKKDRKDLTQIIKSKSEPKRNEGIVFALESITEAVHKQTNKEVLTIKDVLNDFGKMAALNAKYGSFDNLIKGLNIPSTGIISLYSFYSFQINSEDYVIVIVPDKIEDLPLSGEFHFKTKNSESNYKLKNGEKTILKMFEDVQIGLKQDKKTPYIIKVEYPLSVYCFKSEDLMSKTTQTDFSEIVLDCLKKKYPDANTPSEVFAKSVLSPSDSKNEENQGMSDHFRKAIDKLISYRLKKANLH